MKWLAVPGPDAFWRLARGAMARWLAGLTLLVVLLWVAAARGLGMRTLIPAVLSWSLPAPWQVRVDDVEGDWRSHIHVVGLELSGPDATVYLPEAKVEFGLGGLFQKRIDLRRIHLDHPMVWLRPTDPPGAESEHPDAPADPTASADHVASPAPAGPLELLTNSPLGAWTLRVRTLRVDGGHAKLGTDAGSYRVADATLAARVALTPAGLEGDVDSVHARLLPPRSGPTAASRPTAPPVRLSGAGALSHGALTLESLELGSDRSTVRARGRLLLQPDRGPVGSADLTLTATPLDLRDLPVSLPPRLEARPRLELALRASGAADSLVLDADARGPLGLAADAHAVVLGAAAGSRPPFRVTGSVEQDTAGRDSNSPLPRSFAVGYAVERAGADESIGWELGATGDSMSVEGRGSASWDDVPRLVIRRLAMDRLDVSSLWPGLPESSISGRLAADLAGVSVDSLRGELRLDLDRSSAAGTVWDTLAVRAALVPGSATGSLHARARGLRIETDYEAASGDSAVVADLTALHIASVPPATDTTAEGAVTGPDTTSAAEPLGAMEAHGRSRVEWRTTSDRRDGRLDMRLDSARIGGTRLRAIVLGASLRGDRLTGEVDLRVADVAPAPLSAWATVDASLTEPTRPTGVASVSLTPSDAPPAADSLLLTLTADRPGRYDLSGSLRTARGERVALEGSASKDGEAWTLSASAQGALRRATPLLPEVTIDTVAVEASAVRRPNGWDDLMATAVLGSGSWRSLRVDTLHLGLRSDADALELDTLLVRSNALDLGGSGALPLVGDAQGSVEMQASLVDVAPLAELAGLEDLSVGGSDLDVSATGSLDSMSVTAAAQARALVYERTRVTGLDVEGHAMLEPPLGEQLGLTAGALRVGIDRIVLPDAQIGRVDGELTGNPDSLRLEVSADVDEGRRGTALVQIDPRPDRRTARIERIDLQLDRDRWALRTPARFTYRDGYALRNFLLDAGDQTISVDGGFDPAGIVDLSVDMDSTEIGTVADLAGFPGLQGWLGGSADVTGTLDAPEGAARLEGAFHRAGAPPAAASIQLDSDGSRVTGSLQLTDPGGGRLSVQGSVGLEDGADAEEHLQVDFGAEAFDLGWALPFTDPDAVSELGGTLNADVTARGAPGALDFEGTLHVRDGRARLPPLGITYEDLRLAARAEGRDLVLESASLLSGSGEASASGTVALTRELPLDVDVSADDFQAIRSDAYRAAVSGEVHLGGDLLAPALDGDVRIESLDVYLDRREAALGLDDVELTEEDLRMLRERFGFVPERDTVTAPVAERLTADLTVELGRDSWLRKDASPEMAVAFTGDLRVALRPGEEPRIDGSVQTIAGRGFVEQFGRRFELREGSVTFDGPPASASLDVAATYTIPSHDNPDDAEATIVLDIEGTQESLALSLSSEPPMENADIVSYIATGRPAAGTLSFGEDGEEDGEQGGGLASTGAALALDQLANVVEDAAARSVGLDVVEIRREGIREATLVAGKYLSPRLYVGFAQPVMLREGDGLSLGDEGESEIEVEIEALRWLLLNLEGSGSALSFFLRGRHAF